MSQLEQTQTNARKRCVEQTTKPIGNTRVSRSGVKLKFYFH